MAVWVGLTVEERKRLEESLANFIRESNNITTSQRHGNTRNLSEYKRYRKDDDAIWVFEPHIAEQTYEAWIKELQIPVVRDEWLDRKNGVVKRGNRLVAIKTLSGKVYRGNMFLDTTYEGDLMAAAGVPYTVGREANAQYGETLNGVQTRNATKHQFVFPVDPYVIPGDPQSGLLPRIHKGPAGEEGSRDHRLQAYCFRMCLSNHPDNRIPFPKPEGYDPKEYELLATISKERLERYLQQVRCDPQPEDRH